MNIRVRLFAAARQMAGAESIEVEMAEGATVAELREALSLAHPELRALLKQAAFALDEDYAPETAKLAEEQSVACIPPVSGG